MIEIVKARAAMDASVKDEVKIWFRIKVKRYFSNQVDASSAAKKPKEEVNLLRFVARTDDVVPMQRDVLSVPFTNLVLAIIEWYALRKEVGSLGPADDTRLFA